jgi:hypothetical protein
MAPISYNPTDFQWQDWVDNVDRVQASGDNGFNARFQALRAEFPLIANAVTQLSNAIDALGSPPPATVTLTLTPNLVTTSASGWSFLPGIAQKPATQTSAHGMMPVGFPTGAKLLTFRATGTNTGAGSLRIALVRQDIAGDAGPPDTIVQLSPSGTPYNLVADAASQFAQVDEVRFKYYISALLDAAGAGDTVQIAAFQITYQTGG